MIRVVPSGTITSPVTCTTPDHVSLLASVPDLNMVGAGICVGVLVAVAVLDGAPDCATITEKRGCGPDTTISGIAPAAIRSLAV